MRNKIQSILTVIVSWLLVYALFAAICWIASDTPFRLCFQNTAVITFTIKLGWMVPLYLIVE